MKSLIRGLATLAVVLAVVGCSADRSPTAFTPNNTPAARSGDVLGLLGGAASGSVGGALGGTIGQVTGLLQLVHGVTRITPLASAVTVQQVIGPAGGTLSIPEAGVFVISPPGALAQSTEITMTARAGSLVAYDFAPHGIVFARPLIFSQSLQGTSVSLLNVLSLKLGYYEDPSLLGQATGFVTQLIGGVSNLLTWTFSAPIPHFSGYMIACDLE